eukprot:m.464030 g.464030  ORF g.464030 m.464030 type:complete len:84 (+) comp57045_c1_seq4:1598-1849(+)
MASTARPFSPSLHLSHRVLAPLVAYLQAATASTLAGLTLAVLHRLLIPANRQTLSAVASSPSTSAESLPVDGCVRVCVLLAVP